MITFMYRWKIPQDIKEDFFKNWVELTTRVHNEFGMYTATLYECGEDCVSVTHWPDEESWSKWKEQLKNHPYRNRWRKYRVSGPDRLAVATRIGDEIQGA